MEFPEFVDVIPYISWSMGYILQINSVKSQWYPAVSNNLKWKVILS